MDAKKLGIKIKTLRVERGIEQKDLAAKAGISHTYLSNIENGTRNPALKTLEKIALALNVTANELLEEKKSGSNLVNIYIEKQERNKIIDYITSNIKFLETRDLYIIESLVKSMKENHK